MSRLLPTVFDQALASAVRAPSPHNTQPWRFVVEHEHDRGVAGPRPGARRRRPARAGSAAGLRCGGVQPGHLPAVNGLAAMVRMLPDPAEPDLLAVIRLDGNQTATAVERKLAEAVFRRHTNRRPLPGQEVPPALARRAEVRGAAGRRASRVPRRLRALHDGGVAGPPGGVAAGRRPRLPGGDGVLDPAQGREP